MVTWTPEAWLVARMGMVIGAAGFVLAIVFIVQDERTSELRRRLVVATLVAVLLAVPLGAVDWMPGNGIMCDWNALVNAYGTALAYALWWAYGC